MLLKCVLDVRFAGGVHAEPPRVMPYLRFLQSQAPLQRGAPR